jgi:hypothetical protein
VVQLVSPYFPKRKGSDILGFHGAKDVLVRSFYLSLVPAVFLFLIPQLFQITIETDIIMATDHFTVALALPRFLLLLKGILP